MLGRERFGQFGAKRLGRSSSVFGVDERTAGFNSLHAIRPGTSIVELDSLILRDSGRQVQLDTFSTNANGIPARQTQYPGSMRAHGYVFIQQCGNQGTVRAFDPRSRFGLSVAPPFGLGWDRALARRP
jgi:hypothetical protein